MSYSSPIDELQGFLEGNSAATASPNNPLGQGAVPSASPANPTFNPANPNAWNNPSNPQLNPSLPGAVNNPSNPQYNPSMPGAQNNPSNYAFNPSMPGAINNPSSPEMNPAYPGSITNPANPMHNPDFPVHEEMPRPPGISDNASLPPAHASWELPEHFAAWPWTKPMEPAQTPEEVAQGRMCFFHPDRPAVTAQGFAAMCPECYMRYQQHTGAIWKLADNYTQDTREWPDPTEPRAAEPPAPDDCTCHGGTDGVAKLHCPIHGLDGQDEQAMDWSIPEGWPVGYPQDQPRGWTDAVQSATQPPRLPQSRPTKFITTREQHERGKRRWIKRPKPKRSAMDPRHIEEYQQSSLNGPYLYHATTPDAAQAILREGLYPHDQLSAEYGDALRCDNCGFHEDARDLGVGDTCPECGDDYLRADSPSQYAGQYYEPRSGHTYMGDFGMVGRDYFKPNKHQLLRIDMRKLDPKLINPDEDAFNPGQYAYYPVVQKVMEDNPPPSSDLFGEHGMTYGDWAEDANLGQDPEETKHSLFAHGSIAYNGVVPPEAIELADPKSGLGMNEQAWQTPIAA